MVHEILSVKHLDLFAESFFFPYLAACNSILWAVLTKSQLQIDSDCCETQRWAKWGISL